MSKLFNHKKLILKPITPIHIGNGKEILPYEYVVKEDYLYKFNIMSIYENLNESQKKEFFKYVEQDIVKLRSFVNSIYDESFGYEIKVEVCDNFYNLYQQKVNGTSNKNEENSLLVSEFVNIHNKAYIPGSSLKGSLRTNLLYYLGQDNFDYKVVKNNKGRIDGKLSDSRKSNEYENNILNKRNPMDDPLKSIKISDSNLIQDALNLYDINIFTYKKREAEFKRGVPFYLLCTKSKLGSNDDIEFEFNLNSFEGYFNKNGVKKNISIEDLIISSKTKAFDILTRESEFYENCKYHETLDIYDELWEVYNNLKDNETLIRLGKGCGFDSTTFNLVNRKRNNQTDSNSRNLVEGKYPLGWAVIKFV